VVSEFGEHPGGVSDHLTHGRPSTAAVIRKLVIRIGTDNPALDHRRMQDEDLSGYKSFKLL